MNYKLIDHQKIFHIGFRVPDLLTAMQEMGASLGVTWCTPVDSPNQAVWTVENGLQELPLKFVYSREDPLHIELLEGPVGSIWDGNEKPGAHHLGVWTNDLPTETEKFLNAGWELMAASQEPKNGYGVFVYLSGKEGSILELVSSSLKPRFETWWAGGDLQK
tara:strand:- start:3394 stop:3879 length:486 start_codon:yes stop_codon:yes gene_type:complete